MTGLAPPALTADRSPHQGDSSRRHPNGRSARRSRRASDPHTGPSTRAIGRSNAVSGDWAVERGRASFRVDMIIFFHGSNILSINGQKREQMEDRSTMIYTLVNTTETNPNKSGRCGTQGM